MKAIGKHAEMSQVVAGEVKGREMFGHESPVLDRI